jgi:hypothetical protein
LKYTTLQQPMIPNDANRKSLNDVIEKLKKGHNIN